MNIKKIVSTVLAVGLLIFSLASCNNSASDPAPSEDAKPKDKTKLVLYTSEPESLAYEMIEDFNKTNPDVTIEVFRSGTGKVISKMEAELESGETEANMIWFADIGYISQMDNDGLIYHYNPKTDETIAPEYNYNDGMAHEVRLIYDIIAYNTTVSPSVPTDWDSLTAEEFNGKVAIANPNYSGGAFTALVAHVHNADKVGWEFYEDLYKNDVKFEESNGNLQSKVSSGEYSAVIMVDFMARNAKNEGSPIEVAWPESGAVLIPTPVALVNNMSEEQKAAAEAFIDHLYSKKTQELFVSQGYTPVLESVDPPEGAPKVTEINVMPFDLDYFINNSTEIREEYTKRFE